MTKEELKEEFLEFVKTFPQRIGGTASNAFADWWLAKFSSLLQEQRKRMAERIGEEQEKYRPAYEEEDKAYVAGLQAALNIVLGEDNN